MVVLGSQSCGTRRRLRAVPRWQRRCATWRADFRLQVVLDFSSILCSLFWQWECGSSYVICLGTILQLFLPGFFGCMTVLELTSVRYLQTDASQSDQ